MPRDCPWACTAETGPADGGGHNGLVFSPSVDNLVAQLTRLPGVGARTAQRLAFHILQRPKDEALRAARAKVEAKAQSLAGEMGLGGLGLPGL